MKSDEFIREVDEELQREKLVELGKRYGWIALAGAIGLVLATAGWVGFRNWQEQRRNAEAARYAASERPATAAGLEAARALLDFAAEASPGFAALARLHAAALADEETALRALDAVAADPAADPLLKEVALLLAASRRLDRGDPEAIARSLEPFAVDGGPWRHVARQLQAAAQIRSGAREQALATLRRIAEDPEAPAGLRGRAVELLDALGAPLGRATT